MRPSVADPAGELAVADGLAVGNVLELRPDPSLELGALEPDRDIELGEVAGEVGVQLATMSANHASSATAIGRFDGGALVRACACRSRRRRIADNVSGPTGLSIVVVRGCHGSPLSLVVGSGVTAGGRPLVDAMVVDRPQVLHGVGPPGSPRLRAVESAAVVAGSPRRSGATTYAEVGRGEGVGVTQGPHGDDVWRSTARCPADDERRPVPRPGHSRVRGPGALASASTSRRRCAPSWHRAVAGSTCVERLG